MMEVVLTRLRDFSCKTSTFDDSKAAGPSACRDPRSRAGCTAGEEAGKLDIESALAWLRRELVRIKLCSHDDDDDDDEVHINGFFVEIIFF